MKYGWSNFLHFHRDATTVMTCTLLCGWLTVAAVHGQDSPHKPGWVLTFHDEFRGTELDRDKWNTQNSFGVIINDEQQAYVDDVFRVRNGGLRIYALKQPGRYHGKVLPYRSGIITTKDRFFQRYGYFEIRCRLPRGNGYWPTFWTLLQRPNDQQEWPPEIDIMETIGSTPTRVTFNHHYTIEGGEHRNDFGEYSGPDFTHEFHRFACDWGPDRIIWYVDGIERHRTTRGIPQEPMYVLVNLAVGGKFPNAMNAPPDDATPRQASFEIDYVRVYQLEKRNTSP